MRLTVASYNILHGKFADYDMDKLTESIRTCDADLVGVQEVDVMTKRAGGRDIPALMAERLGFEYRFAKAIDLQGGAYGTAILSRYPIEHFSVEALPSGNFEQRSIGCATICIGDREINFWNTHLSYENKFLRAEQFNRLAKRIGTYRDIILTGDFNTDEYEDFSVLGDVTLCNNKSNFMGSFRDNARGIDNIVLGKAWKLQCTGMICTEYSDHNLIFATITDEI